MLSIRLQRVGRKNDPSFRVVLIDSHRASRSGKAVEVLGSYDARKGAPVLREERIRHWLASGAQPSGTVHNLLISGKILEGKKINVLAKKTPPKKEEVKEEVKTEAKEEIQKVETEEKVEEKTEEEKSTVSESASVDSGAKEA